MQSRFSKNMFRLMMFGVMIATLFFGVTKMQSGVSANHPVLVEGESDFDGDGLIGAAEDTDNATDQVFGTINAALGMANAGANQNGRVVIVTSGRFLARANITGANGNVTLEAAPGVEANIEAVRAGDGGNAMRQGVQGIIVNAPATRIITIRNIISRNWTDGIEIQGASRVIIDNCRFENNTNFGIHAVGTSKVTISNTAVNASGFRSGAGVDNTANPGVGIRFDEQSSGTVAFTTVSGSAGAGISNMTGNRRAVGILSVNVFDNMVDFQNIIPPTGSAPGVGRPNR
jgi:parallel beta-helix repeat protein